MKKIIQITEWVGGGLVNYHKEIEQKQESMKLDLNLFVEKTMFSPFSAISHFN